jgi:predicted RNA binding protein YcfA (HicA-like mRNA interferase family)
LSRLYSSREAIQALERAGFVQVASRGSHLKLRRTAEGETQTVIVKHPAREIPAGTFASILRQAGLSRQEFEDLLER